MARIASTDTQAAQAQDTANAKTSYANANSDAAAANDSISSLEANDPYTSKSYLQNQNLLTSGAMNSADTAGAQQLNDAALRTGTNTAALGRTISSNARAGQRTMDAYNANTATDNVDKSTALQMGLIGDRNTAAATQAGMYSTATGGQDSSDSTLATLNGQEDQMWGNIIGGAAGAAGSAFSGAGKGL